MWCCIELYRFWFSCKGFNVDCYEGIHIYINFINSFFFSFFSFSFHTIILLINLTNNYISTPHLQPLTPNYANSIFNRLHIIIEDSRSLTLPLLLIIEDSRSLTLPLLLIEEKKLRRTTQARLWFIWSIFWYVWYKMINK